MGFKNLVYGIYSIISFKTIPMQYTLYYIIISIYTFLLHGVTLSNFCAHSICAIQFGTIIIVNNYDSLKLIDISMIYTMLYVFDSAWTH